MSRGNGESPPKITATNTLRTLCIAARRIREPYSFDQEPVGDFCVADGTWNLKSKQWPQPNRLTPTNLTISTFLGITCSVQEQIICGLPKPYDREKIIITHHYFSRGPVLTSRFTVESGQKLVQWTKKVCLWKLSWGYSEDKSPSRCCFQRFVVF